MPGAAPLVANVANVTVAGGVAGFGVKVNPETMELGYDPEVSFASAKADVVTVPVNEVFLVIDIVMVPSRFWVVPIDRGWVGPGIVKSGIVITVPE